MKRALLLLAHGARDPRWAAPFEDMARRLRALAPDASVRLSFLDFLAPDLKTAGSELVRSGCRRIDVMPLFLGSGGHVRNDVPRLLRELAQEHPQVEWHAHTAIGEVGSVIDAMALACFSAAFDASTQAPRNQAGAPAGPPEKRDP